MAITLKKEARLGIRGLLLILTYDCTRCVGPRL